MLCCAVLLGRLLAWKFDSRVHMQQFGLGPQPDALLPLLSNLPSSLVPHDSQVLSRGGDVAADQLEDTTAAQQQRR